MHSVHNNFHPGLFHRQQKLDVLFIRFVHLSEIGQVSFPLGGFFGQYMTLVSVFSLNLSGPGQSKPLFRAGIRFHLGHDMVFFVTILLF
jgi:hypothetical protein